MSRALQPALTELLSSGSLFVLCRMCELNQIVENGRHRKPMVTFIAQFRLIQSAGNKPKKIEELVGRVNSGTSCMNVARRQRPWIGWPGHTLEFAGDTGVLRGARTVERGGNG